MQGAGQVTVGHRVLIIQWQCPYQHEVGADAVVALWMRIILSLAYKLVSCPSPIYGVWKAAVALCHICVPSDRSPCRGYSAATCIINYSPEGGSLALWGLGLRGVCLFPCGLWNGSGEAASRYDLV